MRGSWVGWCRREDSISPLSIKSRKIKLRLPKRHKYWRLRVSTSSIHSRKVSILPFRNRHQTDTKELTRTTLPPYQRVGRISPCGTCGTKSDLCRKALTTFSDAVNESFTSRGGEAEGLVEWFRFLVTWNRTSFFSNQFGVVLSRFAPLSHRSMEGLDQARTPGRSLLATRRAET